jgi:hypothetical protein
MSRLYDEHEPLPDGSTAHVDGKESGLIKVINEGKRTSTVEMDYNAVKEFLSDMEYQIEIAEDLWDKAYRGQCMRAMSSVVKQINTTK